MHRHQGSSIVAQCPLDDIAGVDGRSGQGAKEQLLVGLDPVLVIEEQCGKYFAIPCLQQSLQGLMGHVFIGDGDSLGVLRTTKNPQDVESCGFLYFFVPGRNIVLGESEYKK